MRLLFGTSGKSRIASTQTLIAVRCIGSARSRGRVSSHLSIGSSAATIGSRRTLDSDTAIATSQSVAVPSVEIRMTCAGAAQISSVHRTTQTGLNPNW
jgi:hypothetical protein